MKPKSMVYLVNHARKNIVGPGVLLEGTLEQLHDCSFLGPYPQASYHGKVSGKKTSIGYLFLRDIYRCTGFHMQADVFLDIVF